MKKLYTAALSYMVLGLAAGLFVRIYVDQIKHFEGETMLSLLHFHLLVLGMVMFLLVMVLEKSFGLSKTKWFNLFFWHYNGGLLLTAGMMAVHGVMQVNGVPDSAAVAGIAGLGHILLTVGLGLLFAAIKSQIAQQRTT
ncbi:DUF2871 domain-containing protein [Patescibacteria group bacterium]|nr:DUF2871 domain-containing protein [Patescibacteria group bacterium]